MHWTVEPPPLVVLICCRGAGMFECDVSLPQGRHEYKLLVDGHWKHDQTQVRYSSILQLENSDLNLALTAEEAHKSWGGG